MLPGLYRIQFFWSGRQGRVFSARTLVIRVLPPGDEPEPTPLSAAEEARRQFWGEMHLGP